MPTIQLKLLLVLTVLQQCLITSVDSSKTRQLKDVQVKIPLQIRVRRVCTNADCVKTCPKDYELDSELQYCRYKRSSCPPNYVRHLGSCVLREVQCPPGSVRHGNRCVVKSFACPTGYVLEGSNCVNSRFCPNGYHWENGFCYQQQHSRTCPHGYDRQNGVCIQICVNCEAACTECEEETVPLKCPTSYESYRGKCLKLQQGRVNVIVKNVTYKVPKECENEQFISDGSCVSYRFENPQCTGGHFYNGKCVDIAKCSRGNLHDDCKCIEDITTQAVCQQGQSSGAGCVVEKAQCSQSAQLVNGVCTRKINSHRPTCIRGSPIDQTYCDLGEPCCTTGFTLDGAFCRRNTSYSVDCGPSSQLLNGWCSFNSSCDHGYQHISDGECIQIQNDQISLCPPSTRRDGEVCVNQKPLCDQDHIYDNRYGICVKCTEKYVQCNESAGYHLSDDACIRLEPLCPPGYVWHKYICVRKTEPDCECSVGFFSNNYCVHNHLTCPDDYELVDNICIKKELPSCPDGTVYQDGFCEAAPECASGYSVGPTACVKEIRKPLKNFIMPACPTGFQLENGNCIKTTWRNSVVESRIPYCPSGYKLANGKCIKEYNGYWMCPPKTILMNQENKCFCKVALICPTGYERIGDDCIFRSTNYFSSFVNFLNPCYGMQCGLQYCITQCFSPPCPVQPCSYGSYQQPGPGHLNYFNQAQSEPCGVGDLCTINTQLESSVSLACPAGYNKENNTCIAYYERICQKGYSITNGSCVKIEEVNVMCALGFTLVNGACIHVECDSGYTRDGTRCKRVEFRSPMPCPNDYVFINGICLNKNECIDGSIEGSFCVRRLFDSYKCPQNLIHHNDSCIALGICSTQNYVFSNGVCRSCDYMSLNCPQGTRRVENMCVYPKSPDCRNDTTVMTTCKGIIYQNDMCKYVETPFCGKGYVLRNEKCAGCSSKSPNCPEGMIILKGKCITYPTKCNDGSFLSRNGDCMSVSSKPASCIHGNFFYGKCRAELSTCKTGYTLDNGNCMQNELVLATCSIGILMRGRCVELMQCNGPDYTLKNGLCINNEYSEPTCRNKLPRTRDVCVGGAPTCTENFYLLNGQCCSTRVQPAKCSGSGKCLENFCSISYPSCSPTLSFDGSVCKKIVTTPATCPSGTISDRNDRSYCQYLSEQAEFICPPEFHYKNGICQKQHYAEASCPTGFRRKLNHCVRKSCNNAALTNLCASADVTRQTSTPSFAVPNYPLLPDISNNLPWSAAVDQICCQIFSPRICRYSEEEDRWSCYHTEHRRCGPFCDHKNQQIHLRMMVPYFLEDSILIMTPSETDDEDDSAEDSVPDCDECTDGSYDCSSYCYTYDCQKNGACHFKDQHEFCKSYPGPGCTQADGCYDKDYCDVRYI
ncbi:proprotein convertase subtilisin/kexin type 5-like [Topomyia yanbarensis]|uniref:proprotein convertase subtilisin/kexin type 5-like n=1 Tax=Topomyia yanbarensis TaxID=2498891 RepID=UPI00273BCE9E|nr:proprotein convertase subtilisin/kexin type 5-like [Topomyia yanbarensis]